MGRMRVKLRWASGGSAENHEAGSEERSDDVGLDDLRGRHRGGGGVSTGVAVERQIEKLQQKRKTGAQSSL